MPDVDSDVEKYNMKEYFMWLKDIIPHFDENIVANYCTTDTIRRFHAPPAPQQAAEAADAGGGKGGPIAIQDAPDQEEPPRQEKTIIELMDGEFNLQAALIARVPARSDYSGAELSRMRDVLDPDRHARAKRGKAFKPPRARAETSDSPTAPPHPRQRMLSW